ncbi:MAG: alpha/beta fold hydrolase [Planctomycetaceae bacterium]|jgi:pimeloyl-ACP methyl ester carboxylesterase|nr:alpha/beta fold hydrolase [Planctomycetaceae bacterium]
MLFRTIVTTILLFIVTVGVVCFTPIFSHAQTPRPKTPSKEDVMRQRMSPTYRHDEREYDRQRIEEERIKEAQAAQAAEQKRIDDYVNRSRDRKTDAGFQTSDALEATIAKAQPGEPIELYGDLFTAFDGVILSATYYPGTDGKESAPVVLLHDKGGNRRDFDALVAQLLSDGKAVLVPDLRGHGKSKEKIVVEFGNPAFFPLDQFPSSPFWRQWLPERWGLYNRFAKDSNAGKKPMTKVADTDVSSYGVRQFDAMALFDTQLWHDFLTYENNQERLNIKKLTIVGIGMGARIGSIWAKFDGGKQTKNLILISPILNKQGVIGGLSPALFSTIRSNISTMIIIGGQNKVALKDAEAIKKVVMGKEKDDEDAPEIRSKCPLIQCNTDRQGVSLFGTSAKIEQGIPSFINDRLTTLEEKTAEKKNDKTLTWAKLKF